VSAVSSAEDDPEDLTAAHALRIAGGDDVAWITQATTPGLRIAAAIPPTFARYATLVIPEDDADKARSDAALLDVLRTHILLQPWWLGYRDTGVAEIVCATRRKSGSTPTGRTS
jgi:hypothetical protein